ncbi:MAG: hypothetical protein GC200_02190 [Tepidisphaera sp.]|nr:hypothetical protein [Tepidisphaera sp.]
MLPDPDQLVFLTSFRTEFEAQALVNALDARGIRAQVFSAAARMVAWEGGINNAAKVFVRRADASAAADLLHTLRQQARGIDWSTIDVGEMEPGETPPPPGNRPRVQGLSPLLWRVKMVGFMLMLAGFVVGPLGAQYALPTLGVCLLLAFLAEPGVPVRSTAQRPPTNVSTRIDLPPPNL